jgi:hypothetical protein
LSPRFADGTFEYVPIPERSEVADGRGVTYAEVPARCGSPLTTYVRSHHYTHYDPEFETYTYGEPSEPKRSQLLRLKSDDYLVFYAGFQGPGIATGTCFVIGYFQVRHVHQVPTDCAWPPASLEHLHRNAHFRRKNAEKTLVVVEGNPGGSKILGICKQLSDSRQQVLREVTDVIGFDGSVMRAVGRWVPQAHETATLNWLRTGSQTDLTINE